MSRFGQVVLGPPGSGKTTYCEAASMLLKDLGRKVSIINLDPANENVPYSADIDINDLICVDDVMDTQSLGPNGSLIYCMEFLETNIEWLLTSIDKLGDSYFIFDFPGQAELFAHHLMMKRIFKKLEQNGIILCSVYLIDAHYANDPGKYISATLLALNSMLNVEIPTVNVLSKVDSIEKFGSLEFGLDFYTDVLDLDYLINALDDDPLTSKYKSLNKAIGDIVSDYSLVTFKPLSIENRSTLISLLKDIDKANGYVYGTKEERNIQRLLSCAVGAEFENEKIGNFRDLYTASNDSDVEEEKILKLIASQNEES